MKNHDTFMVIRQRARKTPYDLYGFEEKRNAVTPNPVMIDLAARLGRTTKEIKMWSSSTMNFNKCYGLSWKFCDLIFRCGHDAISTEGVRFRVDVHAHKVVLNSFNPEAQSSLGIEYKNGSFQFKVNEFNTDIFIILKK